MVELERMDLQQVEIDQQGRLASIPGWPARAELGLGAIEIATPEPVVVSLAEDRPEVRFTLVLPEPLMDVPDPAERSGSFFTCTLIDVEPGRNRRMHVEVACVCAVPAMDFFRLSGGEPEDGVGCNGERLDLGSRVIPRVLAVTGRVEARYPLH